MEAHVKAKVTAKVTPPSPRPTVRIAAPRQLASSRSASPTKFSFSQASLRQPDENIVKPKARINGSAKISVRSRSPTGSTIGVESKVKSPRLRPTSPQKTVPANTKSTTAPKSKPFINTRPSPSVVSSSPKSLLLSPTAASDVGFSPDRLGVQLPGRLHRTDSIGSLSSRRRVSETASAVTLPISSSQPMRVKAKVTNLARPSDLTSPATSQPSSPTLSAFASNRPSHRARAGSISSPRGSLAGSAPLPPPEFYPITTSSPAANPHRYAPSHRPYNPFDPKRPSLPDTNRHPSPPQRISPPTSAVSYSSHSSVSLLSQNGKIRRSGSEAPSEEDIDTEWEPRHSPPTVPGGMNEESQRKVSSGTARRSSIVEPRSGAVAALMQMAGDTVSDGEAENNDANTSDEHDPEHRFKTKAKVDRKIADLEITNRSLLTINAALETTKHRQAKEIRELRRKLRETRLALSPSQFRQISKVESEPEPSDEEEDETDGEKVQDPAYDRVCGMLDVLMNSAKAALEATTATFAESTGATKVLHADDLARMRRRSSQKHLKPKDDDDDDEDEDEFVDASMVTLPEDDDDDDDSSLASENEVEAMTTFDSDRSPSPIPPIMITSPT